MKTNSVTFTAAERIARREAEDALRCGLPMTAKTQRHLRTACRKLNLVRYGKAKPF